MKVIPLEDRLKDLDDQAANEALQAAWKDLEQSPAGSALKILLKNLLRSISEIILDPATGSEARAFSSGYARGIHQVWAALKFAEKMEIFMGGDGTVAVPPQSQEELSLAPDEVFP